MLFSEPTWLALSFGEGGLEHLEPVEPPEETAGPLADGGGEQQRVTDPLSWALPALARRLLPDSEVVVLAGGGSEGVDLLVLARSEARKRTWIWPIEAKVFARNKDRQQLSCYVRSMREAGARGSRSLLATLAGSGVSTPPRAVALLERTLPSELVIEPCLAAAEIFAGRNPEQTDLTVTWHASGAGELLRIGPPVAGARKALQVWLKSVGALLDDWKPTLSDSGGYLSLRVPNHPADLALHAGTPTAHGGFPFLRAVFKKDSDPAVGDLVRRWSSHLPGEPPGEVQLGVVYTPSGKVRIWRRVDLKGAQGLATAVREACRY